MTDKQELLPCPFCGGEIELLDMYGAKSNPLFRYRTYCKCGSKMEHNSKKELIEGWNTRTQPDFERITA